MGTQDLDAASETFATGAPPPSDGNTPAIVSFDPEGRYSDRYLLARGGMGEVRAVTDLRLRRGAVMKIVLPHLLHTSAARRLQVEAEITGQLQHPGVVPIYDSGVLDDGRPFYVMREVRGVTLRAALQELARGFSVPGFRRLVSALQRVCETIAYAHSLGVIHRDLKPDNVMLEAFGSVLVLDWGLARRLAEEDWLGAPIGPSPSAGTQFGAILGTPGYMAPEQAAGHSDAVGAPTDSYALGIILSELLKAHPEPPAPLLEISQAATVSDQAHRPDTATLAEELAAWLDGARRREAALNAVEDADRLRPSIERLRQEAAVLLAAAKQEQQKLKSYDPIEKKAPMWEQVDTAKSLQHRASLQEHRWEESLTHALRLAPDLPEAHQRLAEHYHRLHTVETDPVAALRLETLLRAHDRGRYTEYLRGEGRVVLDTTPSGAEVILYRFQATLRRLVPERVGSLGRTPLSVSLPHGSLLLELCHPDCVPVRYPILLPQGGAWSLTPPGQGAPEPVFLPPKGTVSSEECYVPGGWTWVGGDPAATDPAPLRRVWVDGFVIDRQPVTVRQYLRFLNALPVEQAQQHLPLVRRSQDTQGRPLLTWTGQAWTAPAGMSVALPVTRICWHDAVRYAAWRAAETGQPWRLAHSAEWEKAARGVDRRLFPWGDFNDPTWANVSNSRPEQPTLRRTDDFPQDVSLFGVMGMVGNSRDICGDCYRRDGPPERVPTTFSAAEGKRFVRGGAYSISHHTAASAGRVVVLENSRYPNIGYRLARSVD